MNFDRTVHISALGTASMDELRLLDHYPAEGRGATILDSRFATGGTTGNLTTQAAKLGAKVHFFSQMGIDADGDTMIADLTGQGVDCTHVERVDELSDLSIVLVSRATGERTILWRMGPHLQLGDTIDIDALFGADLTVLDSPDHALRRFLTDLPAHTRPAARLLGTLTYLASVDDPDKIEIALRHDILVGSEEEYMALTGEPKHDRALDFVHERMTGSNLRMAIMTRGEHGAEAVTRTERVATPVRTVHTIDTTGAGDSFAGAVAFAQAHRADLEFTLRFAAATASFVVAGIGAQEPQPTLDDVLAVL